MLSKWISTSVVAGALLGAVAVPGLASAADTAANPNASDLKNAARQCAAERGTTTESRKAFQLKYGTNKNGRNAFGKCISTRARANASLRKAAMATCLDERGTSRAARDAFELKYGAAGNPLQACVVVHMVPVVTT